MAHSTKRLTTAEFIEKAQTIHGARYDYSQAVYKNNKSKLAIICPVHGEFLQAGTDHLAGKTCARCAGRASLDTESFAFEARLIHGNRYDYSQAAYTNSRSKVTILCPTHGAFEQTAATHLQGNGCGRCGGTALLDSADFIEKAQAVHGVGRYDYSLAFYTRSADKLTIICPEHGSFKQKANSHLNGRGCQACGGALPLNLSIFLARARAVHGDRYDYSQAVFTKAHDKIKIVCREHGEFEQIAKSHTSGQGCIQCGFQSGVIKRAPVYRATWIEQAKGRPCTLYFIKLSNSAERFYKVGVTVGGTKKRFGSKSSLGGYTLEALATHKSLNASAIWDWEQSILESFAHLAYVPKNYFPGHTECFSSCEEILSIFPL